MAAEELNEIMKRFAILAATCGVGLLASACVDYPPPLPPPPAVIHARHVRWCFNHHPRYNPDTNVFIAFDGSPRVCVKPWER